MKGKLFLVILVILVFLILQIPGIFASKTRLIFCNVGEGDGAILIHEKTVFLIDAGRNSRMRKCLERHLPFWQTEIMGFISTHPDADHLFGIKSVIKRYSVKYLFSNFTPNKVGEYHEIIDALRDSGVSFKSFVVGEKIIVSNVGEGLRPSPWDRSSDLSLRNNKITISSLWPNEIHKESEKTNLFSNISVITIGSDKFLMLADSEIQTQLELLPEIKNFVISSQFSVVGSESASFQSTGFKTEKQTTGKLNSDNRKQKTDNRFLAIKVSHHGSNKNFSLTLMKTLMSKYAIISVGPNKYGHPGKRVIDQIETINVVNGRDRSLPSKINILRTDKLNDIIFECEKVCELKK